MQPRSSITIPQLTQVLKIAHCIHNLEDWKLDTIVFQRSLYKL
jgi:hypothetical protein